MGLAIWIERQTFRHVDNNLRTSFSSDTQLEQAWWAA
jgi:hypothetical protein